MKYSIKFAIGILTSLVFTFLMFSSDNDKNIKKDMADIEDGKADGIRSFNDGITGELALLQGKMLKVQKSMESVEGSSNEESLRDAQVLLDEATRIKGVFINLTPVGSGGSEMLSSAIKFTDACMVFAEAIIREDDFERIVSTYNDLDDAENEMIATQKNFGLRNNLRFEPKPVDPNDLN